MMCIRLGKKKERERPKRIPWANKSMRTQTNNKIKKEKEKQSSIHRCWKQGRETHTHTHKGSKTCSIEKKKRGGKQLTHFRRHLHALPTRHKYRIVCIGKPLPVLLGADVGSSFHEFVADADPCGSELSRRLERHKFAGLTLKPRSATADTARTSRAKSSS